MDKNSENIAVSSVKKKEKILSPVKQKNALRDSKKKGCSVNQIERF